MKTLANEFRAMRKQYPGINASLAIAWARESIQNEKTRKEWDGETVSSETELEGLDPDISVALLIQPDECVDAEDLLGDQFEPSANPGVPLKKLAKEREAYLERLASEGIFGITACYRGPDGEWVQGDSCWGFEGSNVRESSHYYMRSAMEARDKIQEEARGLAQFAEEIA